MRANFSGHSLLPTNQPLNLLESKSSFGIQIDRFLEIAHNLDECVCEAPTLCGPTLPPCGRPRSMPGRKDGRCELWDPETSLVMEPSEGEMGERRGRPRCQLLAAPLWRCWTPGRVRRASSPEMSTRLSLQCLEPPLCLLPSPLRE